MSSKLANLSEILFRQIHPNHFQDGVPGTDRFKPQPSDDGFMSVDRSTLTSAGKSHALYTSTGKKSAAVFGVSVGEFQEETLKCLADPLPANDGKPANPAHALVEYTAFNDKECKLISKRLWQKAVARKQLHYPGEAQGEAGE